MKGLRDALLERPGVYRAWQAPFAEAKLAPLWRHNDRSSIRRVLDVGCGPGTNAPHFLEQAYLGLDINPAYIEQARRRYGGASPGVRFEVADVTRWEVRDGAYDFILVNSFFHHVSDADAHRILGHLGGLLTPGGHIHVLDLVLPAEPSVARALARLDRGDFPRPLEAWRDLFGRHFREVVFEPYRLGIGPLALWHMVYFKGAAPEAAP